MYWQGKAQRFILVLSLLAVLLILAPKANSFKIRLASVFKRPLALIKSSQDNLKGIVKYKTLLQQNRRLLEELQRIEIELNALKEASQENKRLRGLLDFKASSKHQFIAAAVIGRDSSNWLSSILIDKGTSNGITINMPVVADGALIGRIQDVAPSVSRVILINDSDSRISAIIQRSREEGVVYGNLAGHLVMKYLPIGADITEKDVVVTSGFGGVFPKGFIIGDVVKIKEDPSGLYVTATIKPRARLNRLEEVLCVK